MARAPQARTHHKNRQRLRRRPRARGVPEDEIERIVQRRAEDQQQQRAIQRAAAPGDAELDDTGYKPTSSDPLLRGNARATGNTARAVKRGRTLRRDEME